MRGEDGRSGELFSYVDLEARVRRDRPLRVMREIANAALASLSGDFAALYSGLGRPSVAPERLLRAMLLQVIEAAVEAIAARVRDAGRRFVDTPVSGGAVGARAATLTIMATAPEDAFAAARPALGALGDKLFHVGTGSGQGAMVKTVNQLLCGVHIAAMGEVFALAAKVGVDLELLLKILSNSSASSWMLKDRGPRMLETEPEVTSAVDIFVKDLGIVLEAGRNSRAALPLAAAAHQMFLASSGRGDSADDTQVIRTFRALNGSNRPGT